MKRILSVLALSVVCAALLSLMTTESQAQGPKLPQYPVLIQTDKDAYTGTDHITVSITNNAKKDVWIQPFLTLDRGNGDGTFTPVYRLLAAEKCPAKVPEKPECVRVAAGQKMTLVHWDWNTGGYHQCPPRRPGPRAFKGVHRIIAHWCTDRKKPKRAEARTKWVTWE